MAKTIKQVVTFTADPMTVYKTLMDPKSHEKFTGEKAKISQKVGGKFTAYGDYIVGTNLALTPGKKIVQDWRATDWADGISSKVTYILAKNGKGTKLTFTQSGVPTNQYSSIAKGWKDYYWEPMKKLFAK
jgi:activator of HSP90 ATPase